MRLYIAGVVIAAMMFSAAPAFAATGQNTVDASLILASSPASGFDAGVGLGVGATIDMANQMRSRDVRLAIRGDVSYFSFDGDFFGIDLSYRRLMMFGGPRLYFGPGGSRRIKPFLEGGFELSFDHVEVGTPFGRASDSRLRLGLAGGGGIEFPLTDRVKFSVSGRLHLITDDFASLAATIGTSF